MQVHVHFYSKLDMLTHWCFIKKSLEKIIIIIKFICPHTDYDIHPFSKSVKF